MPSELDDLLADDCEAGWARVLVSADPPLTTARLIAVADSTTVPPAASTCASN